jgi:putative thioredoxin
MEFKLNPDGTMQSQGAAQPGAGAAPAGAPNGAEGATPDTQQPQLYVDSETGPQPAVVSAGGGDVIKDSDSENFMADVIEASAQVPVIVDFWAPWCGPCKQLGPMLEKLVHQAGGLVRLVKVNVDECQEIAAQLRVQSIPMVYAFKDGRPVDAFSGAVPESQLKTFINKLLDGAKPPLEAALDQAQAMLDDGDAESAAALYRQIQAEDPGNDAAIAGVLRATLAMGDKDTVSQIIEALPPEILAKAEVAAAISAFELSQQTEESGDVSELKAAVDAKPDDHQARLDYAVALFGNGRNEDAIDELIEIIRRNRTWNDEAARKQLLKMFEALGPTHELTVNGRRQLSSVLFS